MQTSIAELILLALAAVVFFRVLSPLQAWLERLILRFLDPREREIADAEVIEDRKKREE